MRIKDFIFELQVVIMTLILAFAEFAPVGTNVAMIGYFLAFGIGAVNTVIIISSEIKNRNFIAGVLITLAVSLVLVFEGYYSKGIVILAAIIVVKSQVKLLKKRCCETIDGMKGILPEKTTVFTNGIEGELSCRDLEKGNVTVVKRGQRIPTDGIVFAGKTILDEKVLIGGGSNSDARTVKSGDSVFAGSINLGEEVQIESISTQKDSLMGQVVDRILRVDVNSSEVFLKLKKIVSAAKYFAVIFGVVLISIWIFFMGYEYKSALYWGSFALLLANVDIATDFIEVGMKKFIIRNAKNGIIPKDLDQGNNAGCVDRVIVESNDMYLGGAYKLVKIHSDGVVSKEEMLVYAAHLENEIDHPIATAVKKAFLQLAKYEKISPQDAIRTGLIDKVEYIKEEGVTGKFRDKFVCFGSDRLMSLINIKKLPKGNNVELVHMAINGKYAGYMAFKYIEREGIREIYANWKAAGIKKYGNISIKYAGVIKEINEGKTPGDKTGLISFKEGNLAEKISRESGVDVWFDLGGFDKRGVRKNADLLFLNNGLDHVGSFISYCKKFFRNVRKSVILFICAKIVVYVLGYIFIPSISTTFMIDSAISMLAIYKIA